MEISALALVRVKKGLNLGLSVEQTPSYLENYTRIDFYLDQIEQNLAFLKTKTKYLVADGFYAKDKMWKKIEKWEFYVITKNVMMLIFMKFMRAIRKKEEGNE